MSRSVFCPLPLRMNLDLTTFVMRAAWPAVEEIVARYEKIALSPRDTVRALELLEHPPAPSPYYVPLRNDA